MSLCNFLCTSKCEILFVMKNMQIDIILLCSTIATCTQNVIMCRLQCTNAYIKNAYQTRSCFKIRTTTMQIMMSMAFVTGTVMLFCITYSQCHAHYTCSLSPILYVIIFHFPFSYAVSSFSTFGCFFLVFFWFFFFYKRQYLFVF